ncbi:MAG TPA: hypothetical protein DHV14_12685 [Micrococcales bacterium]|uniref:MBL fold metallo-hydrolase n=1 Tax=Miniimonas arenae TaxID=676201 RepID=UPI000EE8A084|nr:MBL fold metallo-hydrolase [Miniimonas arenae]HCX85963.1 hypothetical protein [Micrococcales bacterium]
MRIERLVVPAPGRTDFTNNVWIVGDDAEVVVVDAAHDGDAIADAVGDRRVVATLVTHGHWDHVGAAPRLRARTHAPVLLHAADRTLWHESLVDAPDGELTDGLRLAVAGGEVEVRHTPGHTPGSCVVVAWPEGGEGDGEEQRGAARPLAVMTGDTLFHGGPGATRWPYSSFEGIVASIRERLLVLPPETPVHTGHGEDTTIGAEAADVAAWLARGW